jgi:hypothetical protein
MQALTVTRLANTSIERDRLVSMAITWLALARQADAMTVTVKPNGDARGWERLTETAYLNDP